MTVSVAGDLIDVGSGAFAERLTVNNGVTIQGVSAAATVVDANASAGSPAPVVTSNIPAGQTLALTNLSLIRGFTTFGGGFQLLGGIATVTNSTIRNNTGAAGGGIAAFGTATLNLSGTTVTANVTSSGGFAAGMFNAGHTLIGNNSAITSNTVVGGNGTTTGLGGGV